MQFRPDVRGPCTSSWSPADGLQQWLKRRKTRRSRRDTSAKSYAVPRVMIWAIPLMGFIGTVVGISKAVAGFSGFLQTAEEIDQIKQAIGGVTTGLAIAFDTTLPSHSP